MKPDIIPTMHPSCLNPWRNWEVFSEWQKLLGLFLPSETLEAEGTTVGGEGPLGRRQLSGDELTGGKREEAKLAASGIKEIYFLGSEG